MKIITINDWEQKQDRFTVIIDNREILCATIGQVCRRIRALCPDLPKNKSLSVPIPESVKNDMLMDATARNEAANEAMEHAKEVMRRKKEEVSS